MKKPDIDPFTTPFTPWVCDRCGYVQKLTSKYGSLRRDPDDCNDFCLSTNRKDVLCGECFKKEIKE